MIVGGEEAAGIALAAGGGVLGMVAEIEGGEGAGGGGFADAGRAGEDQAVREAVGLIGAGETCDGGVVGFDVVGEGEPWGPGSGVRREEKADQMSSLTSSPRRAASVTLC